jgi:DNA-directed RNA polymerase specialized sigma24 family protein
MDDDVIEAKLEVLIRLIALSSTSEMQTLKEKAVRLQKAGLSPKEIAELFDTTPNTVSQALSTAKREAKTGRKNSK